MCASASCRTPETTPITPAEAAWLTELSTKTINTTIDRGELPTARVRQKGTTRRQVRTLSAADVFYLAIRKELASVLSARAKGELYEELIKLDWGEAGGVKAGADSNAGLEIALAGGMIKVELKQTYNRFRTRWRALQNAKKMIVSDQRIRGGEPVIRNTRVPVYLIADLIKQGAGLDEILEDYPSLNASKVRSAIAYVETHPKRGRPKKVPWK